MKKMLTMLFLLFYLSVFNTTESSEVGRKDLDKVLIENITKNYTLTDSILIRLEERDSIAYLNKDSIPILSPIKPIQIRLISSDYGWRIHPIYKDVRRHHGIDIVAPLGTNILSTADGVVVKATYSVFGYGNEVIIAHSNGYETRYAHLGLIMVKPGQSVTHSTVLGTLGRSGLTTGPHLHYEILYNDRDIDPMFFTYDNKKDRSVSKYNSVLIALEENLENAWYVS